MVNNKRTVELLYILLNLIIFLALCYILWSRYIIFEVFGALLFVQIMVNVFLVGLYLMHTWIKKLAKELGFTFTTRFLEQPRMEGIYKKNWWQIHYASREYSEYWGMPRTYIKLQYRENKKFNESKLKKYDNYQLGNLTIMNISHVTRPYKNYLLMRIQWYIISKKKITDLMDLLLDISKECQKKK